MNPPADHHATKAASPLVLRRLPGTYAICRLSPQSPLPQWAFGESAFTAIARTEDELSIIIDEAHLTEAEDMLIEPGWAALRIVGRLEFSQVGILAKLSNALARAGISLCAVSTFDTDIVLVKAAEADRARAALEAVAEFES